MFYFPNWRICSSLLATARKAVGKFSPQRATIKLRKINKNQHSTLWKLTKMCTMTWKELMPEGLLGLAWWQWGSAASPRVVSLGFCCCRGHSVSLTSESRQGPRPGSLSAWSKTATVLTMAEKRGRWLHCPDASALGWSCLHRGDHTVYLLLASPRAVHAHGGDRQEPRCRPALSSLGTDGTRNAPLGAHTQPPAEDRSLTGWSHWSPASV